MPQNDSRASRRVFAVLAYVLPVAGGLLGLLLDGRNPLTRSHAQQSLAAVLSLILGFFTWVLAGYIIAFVPGIGPLLAIGLFSLPLALAFFIGLNWLLSLLRALRGEPRTIPIANWLVQRLS